MRYKGYFQKVSAANFAIYWFFFSGCLQNGVSNHVSLDSMPNHADSLRHQIVGRWGGSDGPPVWEISRDSILYLQNDSIYAYYIVRDSLFIKFDKKNFSAVGRLTITNDTMVIHDPAHISTYAYKRK